MRPDQTWPEARARQTEPKNRTATSATGLPLQYPRFGNGPAIQHGHACNSTWGCNEAMGMSTRAGRRHGPKHARSFSDQQKPPPSKKAEAVSRKQEQSHGVELRLSAGCPIPSEREPHTWGSRGQKCHVQLLQQLFVVRVAPQLLCHNLQLPDHDTSKSSGQFRTYCTVLSPAANTLVRPSGRDVCT